MRLLSKKELARQCGVSIVTLNRIIRDGQGPALAMIGHRARITEAEVERWLASRTEKPPQRQSGA
jgi:excisionase family DNA binding protein